MHYIRALTAAGIAITLIICRFWFFNLGATLWFQKTFGYWAVMAALGWFTWTLWEAFVPYRDTFRARLMRHRWGIVVVLLCGVFFQLHEPHMLKVLQDEPVHVATSFMMHYERTAQVPGNWHYFNGEMQYIETVPAIRMYLFSAILAGVHDVAGYRVENVFILNGILGVVVLGLVYVIGTILAGRRAGVLAVLLMAGLPLLAQNITGGGYDLLNLVMILVLFLTVRNYLLRPGAEGLDLMISSGVLLALSRYESILYLIFPIGAFIYKWCHERKLNMTWAAAFSPLAVWPCFTANFIMMSNSSFTMTDRLEEGGGFFRLHYFPANIQDAVYYLFNYDLDETNSILLSVLGCVGLVSIWLMTILELRRKKPLSIDFSLFVCLSVFVAAMYSFVLTHFWGMPTHGMATRFILPLLTIMALAGVWFCRECSPGRKMIPTWVIGVALVFMVTVSTSSSGRASKTARMVFPQCYAWFHDYAQRHGNDGKRVLYVAPGSLYMAIYGYPSAATSAINARLFRTENMLESGLYDEVLILEIGVRNPKTGDMLHGHEAVLDPQAKFELVATHAFAKGHEARIVRLIPRPRKSEDPVNGVDRPELQRTFESGDQRMDYYLGLLP